MLPYCQLVLALLAFALYPAPYANAMVMDPHDALIQQGIEPHPGPSAPGNVCVEAINISHLANNWPFISERDATFMGISEHSLLPHELALQRTKALESGWATLGTTLDSELKQHWGRSRRCQDPTKDV